MKFLFRLGFRNGRNPRHIINGREDHAGVGGGGGGGEGGRGIAQLLDEVEDDDFRTAATSSEWKIEDDDENEISSGGERYADAASSSTASSSSSFSGDRIRVVEDDVNSTSLENEADSASSAMVVASVTATDGKRNTDSPPTDDCCPICFGAFVVPCRAPCGHWYCGGCILQYWNYGAALQPCNCPMCSRKITSLTPEASLILRQEVEVTDILRNVQKYNRLYLGGLYGFILRVLESPLYIRRMFQDMINPDRPGAHLNKLRIIAIVMGLLYTISPFDFLRIGRQNVIDVFDYSAMALSFILYLVGLYLRRRRFHRVREMAAIQH